MSARALMNVVLAAVALAGCRRHRMSAADCHAVLAKLTTLELAERGFHDPELARRRTEELAQRLQPSSRPAPARARVPTS